MLGSRDRRLRPRNPSVTESTVKFRYDRTHQLPDSHSYLSGPSLTPIERPRCPRCSIRMSVARISPGPKGHEMRYFECSKCDQTITLAIATDPMKSDKIGWLAGELKPPA